MKFHGLQFDAKLNFNSNIPNTCRSGANSNAITKLGNFLGFEEKKVLIDSYFYSDFNYCPLAWMFSHAKSFMKVEAFLYDDFKSPSEEIFEKSGKVSIR